MSKRSFPDKFVAVVSEEDIKLGKKGDSNYCAIARSIKNTLKTSKKVEVSGFGDVSLIISKSGFDKSGSYMWGKYVCYTPTAKKKYDNFIQRFDDGKKVKPTTFTFVKDK